MAERTSLKSEGQLLEAFLEELQKEQAVREIAGWQTGFHSLSSALDGIRTGLYLLVGPPACGKTSFAKQLLDQIAKENAVPGMFFTFADSDRELRIRTLARLSGLENREIRRGSAYLLHWYGVPKAHDTDPERLAPSWDRLKKSAEEAKGWLDSIYLIECGQDTDLGGIEDRIREVERIKGSDRIMVIVDDCQRLGKSEQRLTDRIQITTEELQTAAVKFRLPILAICPDLRGDRTVPQSWSERVPSADVILVMEVDLERTRKLTEPNQALTLHIVKNRGGERGRLSFEFYPAFSRFVESAPS